MNEPGTARQRAEPGIADNAPALRATGRGWATLVLLACATLWSLNGPLIKLAHEAHVPDITVACSRSLLGGLVFLPLAWPRRNQLRRVHAGWPIASVVTFTVMTASFVLATARGTAANAIILQYTSPIWVFLLAPLLLREYPSRREGLSLLVSVAGVAIIFAGAPTGDVLTLFLALLSGLAYGMLTILLRGLRPVSPVAVVALNALGSGLLLLAPTVLVGRFDVTPYAAGLLLFLGLVQFTLPYLLFSWALQRIEAHRASLILLLETVLNPLWTFLAVGEVPSRATFVGGPLILVGVAGWLLLGLRQKLASPDVGQPAGP